MIPGALAAFILMRHKDEPPTGEPERHTKSKRLVSARTWKHVHYTLTFAWLLMLIPTLLWWSDSILWVAGMSLYANVAGHWAAAQAAEADEHSPDE